MKKNDLPYEKLCCNCARSRALRPLETYICRLRGLMPYDSACGRFVFDPLKISPRPTPPLPEVDAEDFAID